MGWNLIFTLQLEKEDIEIISAALGRVAYEDVLNLVQKIQAQINQQIAGKMTAQPETVGAADGGSPISHSS